MNFSTVQLFKVNLMPSTSEQDPLAPSELEEVKKALLVEKKECRWEDFERAIERENEYVTKYADDLKPRREDRLADDTQRQQRKAKVQSEISAAEEAMTKAGREAEQIRFA